MPPKKQLHYRDYGMLSITLLATTFFILFAVRPSISIIFTLNKEKADFQAVNVKLDQKIQEIIQTQTSYINLLNKKFLIDEAIPNSHAISQIAALIDDNSLTVTAFGLQKIGIKPDPKKGLIVIPITLAAESGYTQFLDFVKETSRLPRLFRFKEVTLSKNTQAGGAQGTQSGTIKFTAVIETYYYLE